MFAHGLPEIQIRRQLKEIRLGLEIDLRHRLLGKQRDRQAKNHRQCETFHSSPPALARQLLSSPRLARHRCLDGTGPLLFPPKTGGRTKREIGPDQNSLQQDATFPYLRPMILLSPANVNLTLRSISHGIPEPSAIHMGLTAAGIGDRPLHPATAGHGIGSSSSSSLEHNPRLRLRTLAENRNRGKLHCSSCSSMSSQPWPVYTCCPVAALPQQFLLAVSVGSNCDRRAETSFTDAWYRFFEGLITRAWNRRLQSCQDERRLMHPIHHLFFFTQGGSK